jgi:diadenosine tetraphosphatase ApaH/serine/threonine PP2A family protein phosphatase
MLGCLFDVHGNLPALEAVLADALDRGAERFVLGGDYAAFGGWPARCVAVLDDLNVEVRIRGNWERWVADPPPEVREDAETMAAAEAVRRALGDGIVAEHGALPTEARVGDMLICHASPGSDMEGFSPEPSESDATLLDGVGAPRVVFGHTHHQFHRIAANGIELLNPGSVGLPLDGDRRAAWALIHDDGTIELRRVEYDVGAAIDGLREAYGDEPWTPVIVERLEHASF